MKIEDKVYQHIKEKKISIRELSKQTGIKYTSLYNSMARKDRERMLRAWELVKICKNLDIDPRKL